MKSPNPTAKYRIDVADADVSFVLASLARSPRSLFFANLDEFTEGVKKVVKATLPNMKLYQFLVLVFALIVGLDTRAGSPWSVGSTPARARRGQLAGSLLTRHGLKWVAIVTCNADG